MRRFTLIALLITGVGFVAGRVITGLADDGAGAPQATGAARPVTTPGPVAAGATLPDFTRIAERTVPAVASISTRQVVRRQPSPFDSFFGFGDDDFFGGGSRVQSSLGSGVVVGADGYVLTNNHVVTGEQQRVSLRDLNITVSLGDKRDVPAAVIGVDPATDLALLKIDAKNLPTIPWGDSSKLRIAEWVLAIGNPYQLNSTVTLGIVSAVSRTNLGISAYEDFVQTDAAINPGNSGGALVNARGELVGINTVIFSQSGGYQGIGFAVSANLAKRVLNDLRQYGEVRRGTIGYIQVLPLTPQLAQELSAPDTQGLVIAGIGRSAVEAYRAGLRVGDVLRTFNGTVITDAGQLYRLISDAAVGSTATLGLLREGSSVAVKVPIERPAASR
ncbi:MAG TPA: trypsin-like peptidase domain-containing protein [Vicinamibacterales bacterium]|nr:trypsin-like peptidase domain-containing protein [Vicinamibacterales bacterium]